MQGDADIIGMLNEVLTGELTAVNQYFLHSKLCANWGYARLAAHAHDESIGEMKDADAIIERILLLEGHPNLQRLGTISAGEIGPRAVRGRRRARTRGDRAPAGRDRDRPTTWATTAPGNCSSTSSSARNHTSTGSRRSSASSPRSARRTTSRSNCTTDGASEVGAAASSATEWTTSTRPRRRGHRQRT